MFLTQAFDANCSSTVTPLTVAFISRCTSTSRHQRALVILKYETRAILHDRTRRSRHPVRHIEKVICCKDYAGVKVMTVCVVFFTLLLYCKASRNDNAVEMIEVVCNDRLGKKVRVKCNSEDTIGDLKKLIAAQTGTRWDKIVLKKWYTIFKDHVSLGDYEIHDGMNLELYYQ
ncbi:hypothetical protein Q7C36_022263 [Tachysurus vachellii]|uniref:Ubiquitin-like protein 5 n=6 Tax=Teleostei TaxID=32443 RepID=A0AA88IKK5_TACVA|nr:hypothetical protein Q7C36_022263 [Tachysurus vachellii]